KTIAYVRDIAHVKSGTIAGFNRQIIQLRNGLRCSVHLDVVFQRTKFDRPGWENKILGVDRIHNVRRSEPVSLKLRQVQIHLNLANFSAVRIRGRGSGNCCEKVAQKILAEIEKLLLRESLAAKTELDDRCRRSAIR